MKTTFYVALHTHEICEPESYTREAGKLVGVLQTIFGENGNLALLTKVPLTGCHSEIQITHEDTGLVGRCVVDMQATKRAQLDKPKLSTMIRAQTAWPRMKIEKRIVPEPEDVA